MKKILYLILLCLSPVLSACCNIDVNDLAIDGYQNFEISGPLTISAIEKKEMAAVESDGSRIMRPFGYQHEKWQVFKNSYLPGDCIFHITSDEQSWKSLSGREGYILYRNGEVISTILIKIS